MKKALAILLAAAAGWGFMIPPASANCVEELYIIDDQHNAYDVSSSPVWFKIAADPDCTAPVTIDLLSDDYDNTVGPPYYPYGHLEAPDPFVITNGKLQSIIYHSPDYYRPDIEMNGVKTVYLRVSHSGSGTYREIPIFIDWGTYMPADASCRLTDIKGDVEIKRDGSEDWEEVTGEVYLGINDYIATGVESQCTLKFGNVSTVVVEEMSQIIIIDFFRSSDANKTELEIRIGSINAEVDKKIVTETSFKVTTPTGPGGVRGTKFRVEVDENQSRFFCHRGVIDVKPSGFAHQTVVINARQKVSVTDSSISPVTSCTTGETAQLTGYFAALRGTRTDFGSGLSADWVDDGSGCWTYQTALGFYRMTGSRGDTWRYSHYNKIYSDFTVEADFSKLTGDKPGEYVYGYGMYLRSDGSWRNNYEFNITRDGQYMIGKTVGGNWTQLVNWTAAPALNAGFGQWNTLKVEARGNTMKFYANDTLLEVIEDDSLSEGRIGLFAIDAIDSAGPDTVQFDNVELLDERVDPATPATDFDGDGASDFGIFRSSSGLWMIRDVTRAYWGKKGDEPVPGDYNGDGNADIGAYRPATGYWFIKDLTKVFWGRPGGDLPVPGDYNADGATDIGVFRQANGLWSIRGMTRAYWGRRGDIPLPGDYDGDGTTEIGCYRPSTGYWFIKDLTKVFWGKPNDDLPAPGDYAGERSWRPAVFRNSNGFWSVRGLSRAYWGRRGDIPVPGDYGGYGRDQIGCYRPSTGYWFIRDVTKVFWGKAGDVPVSR